MPTHVVIAGVSTFVYITSVTTYVDTMDAALLPARSPMLLASAIRRLRHDRGMTQTQLAERAGVSRQWLSLVETGQRAGLEYSLVVQLLDALDASLQIRDDARSPR